jgi:hypothetical protein
MNSVTSQYKKVHCGFQDDVIPRDDYFDLEEIVFWEQIPLWKRGPHSNFLPLTRIWNNCSRDSEVEHLSHRHTRLTAFLQRPDSKWGSVAQKNGISTHNPWGIKPQSQPEAAQDHGWGKQEVLTVRFGHGLFTWQQTARVLALSMQISIVNFQPNF